VRWRSTVGGGGPVADGGAPQRVANDDVSFVGRAGGRTSYRLDGPEHAPVLVLLNSLGTSMGLWDGLVPRLAGYARILRYDFRGHGGSSAPAGPYSVGDLGRDLLELLDNLEIQQASLCGMSLGGMVAMWIAGEAPDRVDRLILACAAPVLQPASAWEERAALVRMRGTQAIRDDLVSRWFPPGFAAESPNVVDQVKEMVETCDREGYAACCEAIASTDLRPMLDRIVAPALVLCGAQDPVTPPQTAFSLASSLSRSRLAVMSDASHLAHLAQPEEFTELVLSHLVGWPLQRGGQTRRAVLGHAHVDRSVAQAEAVPFTASAQDLITRFAWGEVWSRPGLDRRTRSAITLAMLVALGRWEELELHLRAAAGNGLTSLEIEEVLLQCGVYAGIPAANSAFRLAARVLAEEARPAGGPTRERDNADHPGGPKERS